MLELLRRGAKSWVAKLMIALLVASFAVWGIGDIFRTSSRSAVAKVGDQEVTVEQYANALASRQNQLSRQAGKLISYTEMRTLGLDRQVLAGLVRDAAMKAETSDLGLSAPDTAVADRIRSEPAFQGPDGKFSEQAYRLFLSQQRMTPVEFEALIRAMIAEDLVTGAVKAADATAPGYASRIAAWQGEQRSLQLLTLDPSKAPDPGQPDEATLEAFYKQEGERFRMPERRYGKYLLVDVKTIAGQITPSEEGLRAAYNAEADTLVVKPTRTVEQITFDSLDAAQKAADRIAAGETTYEKIAAEAGQSADKLSLGTVKPGDLPQASDEAVFGVKEKGQVVAVKTPLGGALLRVTDLTEGGTTPFEDVREQLAKSVAKEEAAAKAPEIANKVEELRAAGKSFEEIAAETGATFGRIEGLGTDDTLASGAPAEGVLTDPAVLKEIRDALEGEERDFVELKDGGYFVDMIDRITPSEIPPLDKVRDKVVAAWQTEQRLKSLEEQASKITESLNRGTGATLGSYAAGQGRQVEETKLFTRGAPPEDVPQSIVEDVFKAKKGQVVTARLPDQKGVVIAQVADIQPMAPDAVETQSTRIEAALSRSLQADRQEYLVRAIENQQGAKIYPQAVEQVFARLGAGPAS